MARLATTINDGTGLFQRDLLINQLGIGTVLGGNDAVLFVKFFHDVRFDGGQSRTSATRPFRQITDFTCLAVGCSEHAHTANRSVSVCLRLGVGRIVMSASTSAE